MSKITWITAAEIEANLDATMAEVMRKEEEWFAWFVANYERERRAAIEDFVANFERRVAEFWAGWKPPSAVG